MTVTTEEGRPRVLDAEPILTTLVKTSTVIREAAYADLPAPTAVLVPTEGHLWLMVDGAEALNRWANWIGRPLRHKPPHPVLSFHAEAYGLQITVGTVL